MKLPRGLSSSSFSSFSKGRLPIFLAPDPALARARHNTACACASHHNPWTAGLHSS